MMRFKIGMAFAMLGFTALAVEPSVVFSANREALISGRLSRAEGYSFGIGRQDVRGQSGFAFDRAQKKAELKAQADLVTGEILQTMSWPARLSSTRIDELKNFVKNHGSYSTKATVNGLQTIYSVLSNNIYTVVVCARSDKVKLSGGVDYTSICQAMARDEDEKRKQEEDGARPATGRSLAVGSIGPVTGGPFGIQEREAALSTNSLPVSQGTTDGGGAMPINTDNEHKVLIDNSDKDELYF